MEEVSQWERCPEGRGVLMGEVSKWQRCLKRGRCPNRRSVGELF